MTFIWGVVLLAIVTALACALPGAFVVLRRNSMLVDGIGHAVLPGIVVGYALTHNLDSPLLIIGAGLSGLLIVLANEYFIRTGLIAGDAGQGLVFPALFSIGVILISLNFSNVHLDVDAVLVGDLNLAAFQHVEIGEVSIGPRYLYVMLAVAAINLTMILIFRRHLTVTTFDPSFASTIGIRTGLVNTAFMFLVSLTVTAAFYATGAILVIALMIAPGATAHLVTQRIIPMLWMTAAVAVLGALAGFWLAYVTDAATSAGMAVFYGLIFCAVLLGTRLGHPYRVRRSLAQG